MDIIVEEPELGDEHTKKASDGNPDHPVEWLGGLTGWNILPSTQGRSVLWPRRKRRGQEEWRWCGGGTKHFKCKIGALLRGEWPGTMKLLAWNCRGLSSPRAVRSLLEVQKRINPDVFFLSETHLDKVKADNVRRRAGFDHLIIHESDGRSGGLLLLWKEEVNIRLQAVTQNYIDVVIEENGGWRFTGVYGEPDWRHKA